MRESGIKLSELFPRAKGICLVCRKRQSTGVLMQPTEDELNALFQRDPQKFS